MKIAIAGFGAMGARFATKLQAAGNEVIGIDQWQAHIDAINEFGLKVANDADEIETFQIPIYRPEVLIDEEFDLIILFTKAMQLDTMLTGIQPLITAKTRLLVLSNGVGNVEIMQQHVTDDQILAGVTMWTSGLVRPGMIKVTGSGSIRLQAIGTAPIDDIITVLNGAGLNVTASTDVLTDIWRKAGVNSVFNPLSVLLDANIAEFGIMQNGMDLAQQILNEIKAVGQAEGIKVDVPGIMAVVKNTMAPENAGAHYPSMYQDLHQGRLTEIDFLNGYFANLGTKHGMELPVNRLITEMIHAREDLVAK
ncbi:2-dehydropantoate 2-reductase [Periweissella cryptocerci]|uniref:2-dehydropantoate 2-reductase n=1 Tax=Periweissella cryptocerci TaxID=2506420 RepID=A0A4P6YUZ8_9LACO|nr:2-dehydropantoate 2-reductase [Periweissella cryptocerci]QBO36543.1 2-dehydropantoate 2-reductase [Periweissella cryptocerci]